MVSGEISQQAIDRANELIVSTGSERGAVEQHLAELLRLLGEDSQQIKLGEVGGIDVLATDCSVVFECKNPGVDNFDKAGTGSQPGESAVEQLDRYKGWLTDQPDWREHPWVGVITNGSKWQYRTWPLIGSQSKPEKERTFHQGEGRLLCEWLNQVRSRVRRRRIPPDGEGLWQAFASFHERLQRLSPTGRSGLVAYETQWSLWEDMLKASDMNFHESQAQQVFHTHCFLVVLARAVTATVDHQPEALAERLDGFVSWIATSAKGRQWISDLEEKVGEYDWQAPRRDVLREVYHAAVPKEFRKAFGEHYTPDWLAEMIVEQVLDEAWMKQATAKAYAGVQPGIGVMDPACGSGTFLAAAARRIRDYLDQSEMASWEAGVKSEIVARLVVGVDLHPVAVELAKATLLRSFPPGSPPQRGVGSLRIYQGDSLLTPRHEGGLFEEDPEAVTFQFRTPQNQRFVVPRFVAESEWFSSEIRDLVESAVVGNPEPPEHLVMQITDPYKRELLTESYQQIRAVVKKEGNGVWAWLVFNALSTKLLSETKVNRMVGNPPWVRMSNVQNPQRKGHLLKMLDDEGLWQGGKQATSTDICSLFLWRVPRLFLTDTERDGSGWVVPWASLRSGQWENLRALVPERETIDLGNVKEAPFTGAKSAVWLLGSAMREDPIQSNPIQSNPIQSNPIQSNPIQSNPIPIQSNPIQSNPNPIQSQSNPIQSNPIQSNLAHWELINAPDPKIKVPRFGTTWAEAKKLLESHEPPEMPLPAPSDYRDEKGEPLARQGATITPSCLTLVAELSDLDDGYARVATRPSRHSPWKQVGTLTGDTKTDWITPLVTQNSLAPFAIGEDLVQAVIPKTPDGQLETDPAVLAADPFWRQADKIYQEYRGAGSSTPKTLIHQIDYNRKLSSQLVRPTGRWLVFYNTSGAWLRAIRTSYTRAVSTSDLYWLAVSKEAAAYLTALLNADILQPAYKASRKSDRHFHKYFWEEVPIPKYDSQNTDHRQLVKLCTHAETVANRVLAGNPAGGQVAVSKKIRLALREDGVAAQIDAVAKRVVALR